MARSTAACLEWRGRAVTTEQVGDGPVYALLLALHGYGSTGNAMAQPFVAELRSATAWPGATIVLAPDGPAAAVMCAGGGRQWYPVTRDEAATRQRSGPVIGELRIALAGWQQALGIGPERTAVVGFSQGGVMAAGLLTDPALFVTAVLVGAPFSQANGHGATQVYVTGDHDRFMPPETLRAQLGQPLPPGVSHLTIRDMAHEVGTPAVRITMEAIVDRVAIVDDMRSTTR